jgi:hypothetical protein
MQNNHEIKLIELNGKWHNNNMPRYGWIRPCYICDTYTGNYYKISIYEIYMCSVCFSSAIRKNISLLNKFKEQLEKYISNKHK